MTASVLKKKKKDKKQKQKKRLEDNITECTGPEFAKSQRAMENREKWRKLVCEVICGAPTTPAVKGYVKVDGEGTDWFIRLIAASAQSEDSHCSYLES